MKKNAVIIVAGGKGMRMQSVVPKQFIVLAGKPVLMHTLQRFYDFDNSLKLVLVLPQDQVDYWSDLCLKHQFDIKHDVVEGGDTRFHSVLNGLTRVGQVELVAVHDGVRPLVSTETLERCFKAGHVSGAVVPVLDSVESIRQVDGSKSVAVDRSKYKIVQTPQVFDANLLKAAYWQDYSPVFTDDASVVEHYWMSECITDREIVLVEGNRENIKITTTFDLLVAEMLLSV